MNVTAPDTITSWVASAFAMHRDDGLGIARIPAKVTLIIFLITKNYLI